MANEKRVPTSQVREPQDTSPQEQEKAQELAWALVRIRYVRRVIQEAKGNPEKGEEVLEALEAVFDE